MAAYIEKEKSEAIKNQLIAASFNAWQMGSALSEKRNWNQYLKLLGLTEKTEPIPEERKKEIAAQAHKIAERIMKMDKKGNKKNARNI